MTNLISRIIIIINTGNQITQGMKTEVIGRARVPIIKFEDRVSGLDGDICLNNLLGMENTKLIATYSKIDPRFAPLAFLIKFWAKNRDINHAPSV